MHGNNGLGDCDPSRLHTPESIGILELPRGSKNTTDPLLNAIQSLERRIFPSSERLTIVTEVAKRNTHVLFAQLSSKVIVGYLIYIHSPSGLRINKVCVAENFRRKGIAKKLIAAVCIIAHKTRKEIDLWVDEARLPARQCYVSCGFVQAGNVVVDYYGQSRNGIRMTWSPE